MQENLQVHQSGCKVVCTHFLKVRYTHMDDFGFKEPGSTCVHAL